MKTTVYGEKRRMVVDAIGAVADGDVGTKVYARCQLTDIRRHCGLARTRGRGEETVDGRVKKNPSRKSSHPSNGR